MMDKLESMGVKKNNIKLVRDGKTTETKLESLMTSSFSPYKKDSMRDLKPPKCLK